MIRQWLCGKLGGHIWEYAPRSSRVVITNSLRQCVTCGRPEIKWSAYGEWKGV